MRKQTLIIAIISIVLVALVVWKVYGNYSFNKGNSGNLAVSDAVVEKGDKNTAENSDWKSDFIESGSAGKAYQAPNTKPAPEKPENLSVTEQFGRDIFSRYVDLKQNGLAKDPNAVSLLTNDLLTKNYDTGEPNVYTTANIIITNANDLNAIKNYGNQFGYIVDTFKPLQNEIAVTYLSLRDGNDTFLSAIDQSTSAYKIMISKLLALPVPSEMAGYHLSFINGLSNMVFIDQTLKTVKTDPAKSISGFALYSDAMTNILTSRDLIREYLLKKKISYTASEAGHYFNI